MRLQNVIYLAKVHRFDTFASQRRANWWTWTSLAGSYYQFDDLIRGGRSATPRHRAAVSGSWVDGAEICECDTGDKLNVEDKIRSYLLTNIALVRTRLGRFTYLRPCHLDVLAIIHGENLIDKQRHSGTKACYPTY
jgi:hypothetical protein